MRREGYEFAVSRPEVLFQDVDGILHEPVEEVVVDVHTDYSNRVIDNLQKRKGIMQGMSQEGENNRIELLKSFQNGFIISLWIPALLRLTQH